MRRIDRVIADTGSRSRAIGVVASVLFLMLPAMLEAQGLTYASGQTIQPAYEGWELNPDGTKSLVFGYLNRNWEETPIIPIGAENQFSPGPADRGQPTYFQPRRNRFVFKIQVPGDWDEDLAWNVTSAGETLTAYASMSPDYYIDNIVIMSENGSLGAGFTDETLRGNRPPTATLAGSTQRRVRVGEPLTLAVRLEDDGVPDRRRSTRATVLDEEGRLNLEAALQRRPIAIVPGKVNGLFVSWFLYRGPDEPRFNPTQISMWEDTRPHSNSPWAPGFYFPEQPEDGQWVAEATFRQPGTYLLKGRADDGGLFTDVEVTVEVTP